MSYASAMASSDSAPDRPAVESATTRSGGGLSAPHLPRPPQQATWWRALLAVLSVAMLVSWVVWYVQTPEDLPTDDQEVRASGVPGTSLYLGMFDVPDGFARSLSISGVKLRTVASSDVTVTPWLCRGGTIGVTTSPEQFCAELVDPAGADLSPQDSVVVEVAGDERLVAEIERIEIGFREGLRWGTKPAGHAGAAVTLLGSGR